VNDKLKGNWKWAAVT